MADDAPKKPESISIEHENSGERFVRTFESDSATLRSGGKPDFMQTVQPAAPAPLTAEDKLANGAASGGSDVIDLDKTPAERLVASSPVAEKPPTPAAETIPVAPVLPRPVTKIAPPTAAPIHTYTSDFAQAVQENKATPTTILAAQQDAAKPSPTPRPQKRAVNVSLIAGAVVLVLLGAGGAFFAYQYANRSMTVPVATLQPAPIFVDDRQEVSGTGAALEQAIVGSVQQSLAVGAVRLVYTSTGTSTDSSVFSALQLAAPDILLRNINAAGSMAGVVNVSGTQSPFFILSVESYSDTFAGMLDWEPTMQSDAAALFPLYTVGTSTPQALATFKDEVVDNENARVLYDTAGNVVIIYGYWNQQTLVIARDKNSFAEIIGRLANSSTQQ